MYSEKSPDDGERNCLKHVEFYSKNKFEKLVHLVGFNIQIYHDAQSLERQVLLKVDVYLPGYTASYTENRNLYIAFRTSHPKQVTKL